VFFSDRQLREIRYASLLHDFGKVGVREQVLVKAEKLDGKQKDLLLQRLRQRQFEQMLAQVRQDWAAGRPFEAERWEAHLLRQQEEADQFMNTILLSNRPTVLTEDVADGLGRLAALEYTAVEGGRKVILEAPDLACLSIRKGSLSEGERLEIESHVSHTFSFLKAIPWTSDLAAVPDIAHAHHERLNGKGYPARLEAAAIPLQSKAMAITDVFDALTAQDRPYKKAVPLERSLGILEEDARSGHLDPDLLQLFIEAKVYERTLF
jgi:response regulator RpfG family c-di-GMP phosphodiesterase